MPSKMAMTNAGSVYKIWIRRQEKLLPYKDKTQHFPMLDCMPNIKKIPFNQYLGRGLGFHMKKWFSAQRFIALFIMKV